MQMRGVLATISGLVAVLAMAGRPAMAQRSIACSSDDGKRHYCAVDTRGGVSMTRQKSDAACEEGYSWDYDRRGIWVDHGCRADFVVNSDYGAPPAGSSERLTIACTSDNGKRHYCPADTSHGVRIFDQRGKAHCTEGYSWGFDRHGIWVDHGCRADFRLHDGIR
ncbi:MAG TPA: DUF3011 domain-containing protein [Acidobacteriaceae bacterium]|jgi:hypothetical protein